MTTLVIGASGMLGRELAAASSRRHRAVRMIAGRGDLDITDSAAVERTLRLDDVCVVLNATGYTDVDGAESDQRRAFRVNAEGPETLARACAQSEVPFVHYSTDYVFDGTGNAPRRAEEAPAPANIYGHSKLEGERLVREIGGHHLIIRTSWLFASHGRNFVRTILERAAGRRELTVVADQIGRPTSCRDLAEMTLDLLDAGACGTLHAANDGSCSWYEFATEIGKLAELDCAILPCDTAAFPRPARRPAHGVLDLSHMIALIGRPRHWREALRECLCEIKVGVATPNTSP